MAFSESAFSAADLRREIEQQRESVFLSFLTLFLIVGWAWFPYMMFHEWSVGANTAPTLICFLACGGAYALHHRRHGLACGILVAGAALFLGTIAAIHPQLGAHGFFLPLTVAAHALLGPLGSACTAALACALSGLGAAQAPGGQPLVIPSLGGLILLYTLTGASAWFTVHPLGESVKLAFMGWTQAREALRETRERRAELYRALRALDEAASRIQRMNDELIVARREAEAARAAKARFAATVSHELRGPMNLILGFSRMMVLSPERYDEVLPRCYRADLDAIYRNSQHMEALVDDVLDLSQLEAERLVLVKDRVDVDADVVQKAAEIVRPLAERKGLFLHAEPTPGLPWVLADAVRLRQVLLNLLTNAVRFTERGGTIVRTCVRDQAILVSVHDTGWGIAQAEIPELFTEFRRLQSAADPPVAGSGLGLSICKHFIELHGGEIWVESQEGHGSVFYFTVPLPGSTALTARVERSGEAPHRIDGQGTCLVVHRDPSVVRLLSRYIENHRIVGVADDADVLTMALELRPHAVLTSHQLGDRVAERLAVSPREVPIITCDLPRTFEEALGYGVVAYLTKPVAPDVLTALMRRLEADANLTTEILLVDDDPDTVRLMEMMLTALPRPYRIRKAYDGEEALARMRESPPTLVFLDLLMPGLDGQQVLRQMRTDEALGGIPVVIVSALDTPEDDMSLGMPLSVSMRGRIPMAQGARCLQAMLDALGHGWVDPVARA